MNVRTERIFTKKDECKLDDYVLDIINALISLLISLA